MKLKFIIMLFIVSNALFAQKIDIQKFSDPLKYGWQNQEERIEARNDLFSRQKLLQIYKLNKKNIYANVVKSILVPGWGHFAAKRYTKGQVLLGMEIALIGSGFYYYDQASEYYNKYKKATNIVDIENYYEKTKIPLRFSQGFFTLGTIIWLYTIYDSASATREYNKDIWENLILDYHNKKLMITPSGFSLRF